MSEFRPDAEDVRKAIQWISDQRQERPEAKLADLINEASRQFDLGPMDEEFLWTSLARPPTSA